MNKSHCLIATTLLVFSAGTALAQTTPAAPTASTQAPATRQHPLDTNQDGLISRSEAAAHPRLAERFDELDKNGDGKLDRSELPPSPKNRMGKRGTGPDGPGRHFAALDKDGDGRISKAEAAAEPKFAERFAQMDANKDGYVDGADRQARMKQRRDEWFQSADTNKDGSLSKAEYDAAQAARMDQAGGRGQGRARMPATPASTTPKQ